ncbi:MAG: hypothetical protein ACLSCV_09670 [Acutalibacteraceae bacterium]
MLSSAVVSSSTFAPTPEKRLWISDAQSACAKYVFISVFAPVFAASEEASDAALLKRLDTASDTADDGVESTEPLTSCAAPSSLSETLVPASTI